MNEIYYGHNNLLKDLNNLSLIIEDKINNYEKIVAINRGGLVVGTYLGLMLGISDIIMIRPNTSYTELNNNRILLVSDLVKSGKTIQTTCENNNIDIRERDLLCIHYFDNDILEPRYYIEKYDSEMWINYYWNTPPFPP